MLSCSSVPQRYAQILGCGLFLVEESKGTTFSVIAANRYKLSVLNNTNLYPKVLKVRIPTQVSGCYNRGVSKTTVPFGGSKGNPFSCLF